MGWWAQGLGGRGRGISSAIPRTRESLLEALLAPWALGAAAGPRGSPPLPAAVKGRAAVVWAEPNAEGLCPALPSSPALFSPESTWRAGLWINPSLSQARAPRLGSALYPPLPGSKQSFRGTTSALENHSAPTPSPCAPSRSIGRAARPAVLSLAAGEH